MRKYLPSGYRGDWSVADQQIDQDKMNRIARSMQQDGWQGPPVEVHGGHVVQGHHRVVAASHTDTPIQYRELNSLRDMSANTPEEPDLGMDESGLDSGTTDRFTGPMGKATPTQQAALDRIRATGYPGAEVSRTTMNALLDKGLAKFDPETKRWSVADDASSPPNNGHPESPPRTWSGKVNKFIDQAHAAGLDVEVHHTDSGNVDQVSVTIKDPSDPIHGWLMAIATKTKGRAVAPSVSGLRHYGGSANPRKIRNNVDITQMIHSMAQDHQRRTGRDVVGLGRLAPPVPAEQPEIKPYTVITQHEPNREVRRHHFDRYGDAVRWAEANNPDTDGSMVPNIDPEYGEHPNYEKGMFWPESGENRYAAIHQNKDRPISDQEYETHIEPMAEENWRDAHGGRDPRDNDADWEEFKRWAQTLREDFDQGVYPADWR